MVCLLMRHLLGAQRNGKEKGAALPDFTLDPDPASVHLDEFLGDAQTQARSTEFASDRRVDLTELGEHVLQLFLGNPHSGVRHAIDELAANHLHTDFNPSLSA